MQDEPPSLVAAHISVSLSAGMSLTVFQVVLCIENTPDSS